MKRYSMSFASSLQHKPEHPERTAKRDSGWDVVFQVWPNRASMLKTVELEGRSGKRNSWKPVVKSNPARFITTGEKELRVLKSLRRIEAQIARKGITTRREFTTYFPKLFRRYERMKQLLHMVEHRHKTRPTVHRNPLPAAAWAAIEAAPMVYAAGEATYHAGRAGYAAYRKYKASHKKRSRR